MLSQADREMNDSKEDVRVVSRNQLSIYNGAFLRK